MRAKFKLDKVTRTPHSEQLSFSAVTTKPFDTDGKSEDNSFARYTPTGSLEISCTNPDLFGKFNPGECYYLDFTKAD